MMNLFKTICLNILITPNSHINNSSPSYIEEKLKRMEEGTDADAFAMLDPWNMSKVINYCKRWSVPVPEELEEEARMQIAAAVDLGIW